jgi:hypothetical protein
LKHAALVCTPIGLAHEQTTVHIPARAIREVSIFRGEHHGYIGDIVR